MDGETTEQVNECDENQNDHPEELNCDKSVAETFSTITNVVPRTPEQVGAQQHKLVFLQHHRRGN